MRVSINITTGVEEGITEAGVIIGEEVTIGGEVMRMGEEVEEVEEEASEGEREEGMMIAHQKT